MNLFGKSNDDDFICKFKENGKTYWGIKKIVDKKDIVDLCNYCDNKINEKFKFQRCVTRKGLDNLSEKLGIKMVIWKCENYKKVKK